MPGIRWTNPKGCKEAEICLSSWLTHGAQWQLSEERVLCTQKPCLFSPQQKGWHRSDEMVHPEEYLLTQTVMLTDMWTGRHRGLTSLLPRLWHGWHFSAWVLITSCSWGCWCLTDGDQHRHCATWFLCCHPSLCQMVVSRCFLFFQPTHIVT